MHKQQRVHSLVLQPAKYIKCTAGDTFTIGVFPNLIKLPEDSIDSRRYLIA